ncbi:MAG: putative DNA-binding domain-containing protein [Myxococcales bacterium]
MSLADTWAALRPYLLGESSLDDAARALGPVRSDRLALYRAFVDGHLHGAVGKIYSATRRCLGEERWRALVADYGRAHPLSHWEYNENARAFAPFLHARLAAGDARVTPGAAELATFEWNDFEVALDPAVIGSGERPDLNPTARLLGFRFDVGAFAADPQAQGEPGERSHSLLLFREPSLEEARFVEATPEVLFVVKMLAEGVTDSDASRLSGVPVGTIRGWMDEGRRLGWLVGGGGERSEECGSG